MDKQQVTGVVRYADVPPSAASFVESLRDIGYSLKHAIADIVDNSITAGATRIQIITTVDRDDLSIKTIDNGKGMSEAELLTAMRLGSRSPREMRDKHDLGRFGLGLKTASFSQCRKLEVYSQNGSESSGAIWDLDYVRDFDEWKVILPEAQRVNSMLADIEGAGTVVLWSRLDRLCKLPLSDKDIDDVTHALDEVKMHLEIVFHRFLQNEGSHQAINIEMNGRPLDPFDPFWESHSNTTLTPPDPEKITFRGGTVSIQAFTLPHHSSCTRKEWEAHAGRGGYVANQGFYLYRARRLLIWGTWFGLDRRRAINQLCRVKIDVDNSLDAEWKVDIRKSSAHPPAEIRRRLKSLVDRITEGTRRVYKKRGQRLVSPDTLPVWTRNVGENGYYYVPSSSHPLLSKFKESLDVDLVMRFEQIVAFIGASLPYGAILSDVGEDPGGYSDEAIGPEEKLSVAVEFAHSLKDAGFSNQETLAMTSVHPAFKRDWKLIETEVILSLHSDGAEVKLEETQ